MYKEMDWNPAEWFTGCSLSDEILLRPSKLTAFGLSVALGILRVVRQSGAPERSRGLRPKACAKWIRLSVILSVVVKGDLVLSLVILLKVRCVAGTVLVRSSVVLILRVDLLIWIVCRVVVLSCDRISKVRCVGIAYVNKLVAGSPFSSSSSSGQSSSLSPSSPKKKSTSGSLSKTSKPTFSEARSLPRLLAATRT